MTTKQKLILKEQSGVALVIALIMIVVLTVIGLASTLNSTFELRLSGNKRGSTDCFYTADSGIQAAESNIANFNFTNPLIHSYLTREVFQYIFAQNRSIQNSLHH